MASKRRNMFYQNKKQGTTEIGAGERVCRVCASQFKNLIPIFNETGIKNCIPHMIDACLPIMVEKTDLWPKYICEGCLLVLKQSYALQEQSMDAEKKFGLPMIDINECFYASQQPIVDHTSTGGGLFELGEPSTRLGPITNSELNLTALQTESHSLSLQPGNFHENLPTNEELTIGDELCNFADLGSLTNDFMFDLGTFLETSGVQPLETLGQCPINIGNVVEFDGPETSSHVANVNYSCGACGKGFCTLEALDDHMQFHPLVQLYKCRICQFECLTRDLMETHIMVHYSALKPEILVDLKCHRCGIEYKSKKRYYSHKCLRPDSKKYGCKLCSKYFLLENRLDLHMKYQHGDKPGRCDICRKRFRTEVTLFQHYEKKHERVVPYVCNDCGIDELGFQDRLQDEESAEKEKIRRSSSETTISSQHTQQDRLQDEESAENEKRKPPEQQ
ncbi:hypothetical protein AAG570_008236 [Ranatra chinensis]|uniref:Uncharacterized protein n=1 Tax=Ranatra chinensis TaxID=642074 RepID=A0ABD0YEC3_9HEMI